MSYNILKTDKFNDQIQDIILYIASANSKKIALAYLNKIEGSINQLQDFPYKGVTPRYQAIKKQGFRCLIVESHLIFYKVFEDSKTIILFGIFSCKQEYLNLI